MWCFYGSFLVVFIFFEDCYNVGKKFVLGILISFRVYDKVIKDFRCYFNYYVCYGIVEEGIFFV